MCTRYTVRDLEAAVRAIAQELGAGLDGLGEGAPDPGAGRRLRSEPPDGRAESVDADAVAGEDLLERGCATIQARKAEIRRAGAGVEEFAVFTGGHNSSVRRRL